MIEFDIGNIYSHRHYDTKNKTYYVAVKKLTLVTCQNGKFGEYTTSKNKHHLEASLTVKDLCQLWSINIENLDCFMSKFFTPDDQALVDAKKRKHKT